jgi:hypothetical protein
MRALRHANEIRSDARLKREDLLLALPKIGPARATRWLSQCRIAPTKTLGGLTDRQRTELIGLLRH